MRIKQSLIMLFVFVLSLLLLLAAAVGITDLERSIGVAITLLLLLAIRIWSQYMRPNEIIMQWIQRIRAGNFDDPLRLKSVDEYSELDQDLSFITEMLRSLSRDAETQVQRHTAYIAQKTRSLSILYDIASSINSSENVDSLLTRFLHTTSELINSPAASATVTNEIGNQHLVNHINCDDEGLLRYAEHCQEYSKEAAGVETFPLLQANVSSCSEDICQRFFAAEKMHLLLIPLQYHGKLLGVFSLYLPEESLNDFEDLQETLTSVGRHLGAAIEREKLDEQKTQLSIMRERTHIANELHDSLAQTLTSIRFRVRLLDQSLQQGNEVQVWDELEKVEATVTEAHAEIRELIAHFRSPTVLANLISAVEQTIERFRQINDDIQIFFQNEWPQKNLPTETEFHVLRIMQESLNNIRKHSEAENVRIMMACNQQGSYKVLIEDDGVGFKEPQSSSHSGEHIGLSIMQDRARRFGGVLEIESEPGEGTRIVLEFSHEP
jgi:two-component system nitrate/nitrite sensor histidine kinase NarX|tara:strand:+ start:41556 stop:43037 length:1482 start_codon:yes stop_codon:yes gene_type:complete